MQHTARAWFPPEPDDLRGPLRSIDDAVDNIIASERDIQAFTRDVEGFGGIGSAKKKQEAVTRLNQALKQHAAVKQQLEQLRRQVAAIGPVLSDAFHDPLEQGNERVIEATVQYRR